MQRQVWVVIPAYNEASAISQTLHGVAEVFPHVVVVDDHSSDDTGELAVTAGAHVCRHPINLGQGASLQTGIDYALSMGAEFIIMFDADGQHRVSDAKAMLDMLITSKLDIVLASRFLGRTENMPWTKGVALKLAVAFTKLTSGLDVTDTHNGLRVMTRRAAEQIRLRQNRMAHASEILDQVAALKLKYAEYPATVIYTDYSRAKGQRLSGGFTILSDLLIRRLFK